MKIKIIFPLINQYSMVIMIMNELSIKMSMILNFAPKIYSQPKGNNYALNARMVFSV